MDRRIARLLAGASSLLKALAFALRRRALARRYLRGRGLEIGALHRPLRLPAAASVRYVDRATVQSLREHYPELSAEHLVDVDVIDDGETLSSQADASTDFIIANHFIEHTQDPLGTLENHLRVLRPGGILYLAVPDRRRTFDAGRPPTPLEHLIRDHDEGAEWSRRAHLEEWARLVERVPEPRLAERVRALEQEDYSIHYHVWDPSSFRALLDYARDQAGMPFSLERVRRNGHEFIAILRRT
jgi:SAM-dependent methyltransferase